MRSVILSDVHSNLEALEAMYGYLEDKSVDSFIALGDLVGYGTNPNECLERVSRNARFVIQGNHDRAVADDALLDYFNDYARTAIEWTRERLEPKWKAYLADLPLLILDDPFVLAHGSPDRPEEFRYLFYFDDALASFQFMDENEKSLAFIGHTHVPQIFMKRKGLTSYLQPGLYELDRNEKYIVNVGSVGQPRDRDPRLCFAIFDEEKYLLEIVRLEYNNRLAAEKIRKAQLPSFLADRLL